MKGTTNPDRTRTRLVIREPLGLGYTIGTEKIREERVSRSLLVSMMLCQPISFSLLHAQISCSIHTAAHRSRPGFGQPLPLPVLAVPNGRSGWEHHEILVFLVLDVSQDM